MPTQKKKLSTNKLKRRTLKNNMRGGDEKESENDEMKSQVVEAGVDVEGRPLEREDTDRVSVSETSSSSDSGSDTTSSLETSPEIPESKETRKTRKIITLKKKIQKPKDRSDYQSCREEDEKKQELIKTRGELFDKKKECEEEQYGNIAQYFEEQTLNGLLCALFKFYTQQKKEDNSYTLTLREFVYMFPRDNSVRGFNFRRQHVFEAICRLLLLFNYDNDYFGKEKTFYKGLENYVDGKRTPSTTQKILDSSLNESSAEGKVDIFFKIGKHKQEQDIPPCEKYSVAYQREREEDTTKDLFVLIQNKFMEKEYASSDKYDVTTIAQRARPLSSDEFKNADYKIVLMINNKSLLDSKIRKARHNDFDLISDIFGLEELENWFQNLLYDMYKSSSFKDKDDQGSPASILEINQKGKEKPVLENRFHQELIVRTTQKYLNLETPNKRKKFIWGCVPRSGKSYMVAGLVKQRNMKGSDNNILIILGAKRETETQFYNMFDKYDDFKEYEIITEKTIKKQNTTSKTKFIFILSQELIKFHQGDEFLNKNFKKPYPKLFEKKTIDIYFDEIHKGGSTVKAQENIIKSLIKDDFQIDLFVMVTATYARPSIAYNELVSPHPPIILNWSYIDQQRMKTFNSNEMTLKEFKESRNNDVERETINELITDYEGRYGSDYKRIIEDFYKKYPELVLIQPIIETENVPFNLHGNLFRLQCSAIGTTEEELIDPTKIFEDNNSVLNLLNFIGRKKEDNLDPECLYGKLRHQYNYDVINRRHTQLWFLPYSDLYTDRDNCGFKLKRNDETSETTGYEEEKISMPNIEPLARGLVLNLLNNELFKKHFCFLIVHGKPNVTGNRYVEFYNNEVDKVLDRSDACVSLSYKSKNSIGDVIRKAEIEAYKKGKSLIILTGQMLRLGISAPCADIGLNFDNIKSIDQNYQTMFRVLTERRNKPFGYYVDFYPQRSINFLYQFNEIYGEGLKKANSSKKMVTSIQSLLYLFNYNGLGIKKMNTRKSLDLYNTLVNELKLNEKEYRNYYVKDNQSKIKTILGILPTQDIIKQFKNISIKHDGKKNKINKNVRKGESKQRSVLVERDDEEQKEEDTEQQEEIDEKERLQDISELINTVVNILAIFSYKESYDCSTIIDCIDKILEHTKGLDKLCQCEQATFQDGFDVLGCYLEKVLNYSKQDYIIILNKIKKILNDEKYNQLNNLLNIIFDNIRNKLGGDESFTTRLIQNEQSGGHSNKTRKRNRNTRKKTRKKSHVNVPIKLKR